MISKLAVGVTTPTSEYGVDVAVRRADDLDRQMLEDISALPKPIRVLDLGAGAGGQSARLLQVGAHVHAVDLISYEQVYTDLRQKLGVSEVELKFSRNDIRELIACLPKYHYDCICLQRTLHYLTYSESNSVLSDLAKKISGRMYISVTGKDSAIGMLHPLRTRPIEERFAHLPPKAAETFSIHAPLCVYSRTEFNLLLTQSGWHIEKIWESTFGNIKVVAYPHCSASPHL